MAIPTDVLIILNGATLASVGAIVFRAGGAMERLRAVERDVAEIRRDVKEMRGQNVDSK